MTDYLPCFTDVDDNWVGRWTLLRNFLRRWYSTFEYSEQSRQTYQIPDEFPSGILPVKSWGNPVADVEERLNVTLPPSLREWHSLFYQTNSHYFNLLRDDHAMLWTDDGNVLVFRVLCEGNVAWGVQKSDLDKVDPLVYELNLKTHGDDPDSWRGTEWTIGCTTGHRVSEWLIHNIVWYLANHTSINVLIPDTAADRDKLLSQIEADSERLSQFGRYSIFESTNSILAFDRETKSADCIPVYFAKAVDFPLLPAWIVNHTRDDRVVSSSRD